MFSVVHPTTDIAKIGRRAGRQRSAFRSPTSAIRDADDRLSHWSTLETVYSRIIDQARCGVIVRAFVADLQLLHELHLRAALAPADVAAQLQGLLECQKARRAIAGRSCHPQKNDVAS